MKTNRLNLNPSKTQLIWFGTRQQLLKLDHKLIASTFPDFTFSSSVRDLGVTLDSELTFADHISLLTRSCFYQLRRLRAIRRSVSPKVFLTIVHAFVCTCIDYCNSLLIGRPKTRLVPRDVPDIHLVPGKCRVSHYSVLSGPGKVMGPSNKKKFFFTFFLPKVLMIPEEDKNYVRSKNVL